MADDSGGAAASAQFDVPAVGNELPKPLNGLDSPPNRDLSDGGKSSEDFDGSVSGEEAING